MSHPLRTNVEPPAPPLRDGPRVVPGKDSIASWLDLFGTLMRVPPHERDEACAELESHLRDRTRDFMLAGLDAEDAARRAIAEVGEAAELAARYRATRVENQRRNAMQFTGIGLAAGAAVVSIAALFSAQNAGGGATTSPALAAQDEQRQKQLQDIETQRQFATAVEREQRARADADREREIAALRTQLDEQRQAQALLAHRVASQAVQGSTYQPEWPVGALADAKFDGELKDANMLDALEMLAKAGPAPGTVHRELINDALQGDRTFSGRFRQASVADVLVAMNERLRDVPEDSRLDARVGEQGAIEIATRGFFDRRETTLVAYDLGAVLGDASSRSQTRDAVVMSVMQIVYPEGWKSNGGDYAEVHMVNDTMFVRAPARYHHSIRWVVGQIRPGEKAAGAQGAQALEQIALKR